MMRPIHPGLAPNLRKEDALSALKQIAVPWRYFSGDATKKLEQWFETYYGEKAYAFSSGRGALFAILHSLGVAKGDEVLVEAFTCVAVIDAILALGAMPVYIDIEKDFSLDLTDAKKKLSVRTKALIIQHTFAIPNYKKGLDEFLEKTKLPLVEDMAHGIGIEYKNKKMGTKGIATLFSFGRDKAFSAVSGGMVITRDKNLAQKISIFQQSQQESSLLWVFQNLFHMVSFYFLILPFYDVLKIGKFFLVLFQNTGLLSKPIDKKELEHFSIYTTKLSPALAKVAYLQLRSLNAFNKKREEIVSYYNKEIKQDNLTVLEGPLLRYPVFLQNPKEFKQYMRQHGVYVGDWYSNVIDPKGTDIYSLHYQSGLCPRAELIASHIANLPTYPTLKITETKKVATLYRAYVASTRNQ